MDSNPNPSFITVGGNFGGTYTAQLADNEPPTLPAGLVSGTFTYYQFVSSGSANPNEPDPTSTPVGK